ncbi:hypothetical protein ACIO6T_38065 [Streptomyces sp. NPDC087532]|uniref:hypothetical protein n=1 Tax=Streptomyces sp. NPDC087532 TaxID=3365795 RepID=UPI0037F65D08
MDYTPPAALAASTLIVGLFFFTTQLALASRFLREHRTAACTTILLSCTLVACGVLFAARWFFAKYGLYAWQIQALVLVVLAMGWTAPDVASYVFPPVEDRFARELGGAGKCLQYSPYRLADSRTTFSGRDRSRMTIRPLQAGVQPLRLDNAVDEGIRHLEPADRASRKLMNIYGC